MDVYNQHKCNVKGYIGAQPVFLVCEPKALEFVLNSSTIIRKSWSYNFLHNWLGTGLLTSTGNKWRKHRKILTPAFHFQILEEFIDIFNSASDILVSKLEMETKQNGVDIYPFVARCTLDIICESAMGVSVNAQDDCDSEYVRSVNILLEIMMRRSVSPLLGTDFIYSLTPTYRQEMRALQVVHGQTKYVLNSRKASFKNKSNSNETSDTFGTRRKRAFLDLMLEYSQDDPSFTEEDICEEMNTFMFEGHDTTATSISFVLYSLSRYPDIQKRAYDEVQRIFSDDPKRNASYKDLQEMKYLEMVIKESLRVYPTVPLLGRELDEDVVWNGTTLPKGTTICIFAYGIQNSDFFDKPDLFDPERFTPENTLGRNPFNYIPFSAGPRNCIGQKFAMLEMKSTVSKVLRKFELLPTSPEHKVILKADGVLKSDNGVVIKLKKRS